MLPLPAIYRSSVYKLTCACVLLLLLSEKRRSVSQPQLRVPELTSGELPKTATLASDWLCIFLTKSAFARGGG